MYWCRLQIKWDYRKIGVEESCLFAGRYLVTVFTHLFISRLLRSMSQYYQNTFCHFVRNVCRGEPVILITDVFAVMATVMSQ
jgi:hypothetical protein